MKKNKRTKERKTKRKWDDDRWPLVVGGAIASSYVCQCARHWPWRITHAQWHFHIFISLFYLLLLFSFIWFDMLTRLYHSMWVCVQHVCWFYLISIFGNSRDTSLPDDGYDDLVPKMYKSRAPVGTNHEIRAHPILTRVGRRRQFRLLVRFLSTRPMRG